MSESAPRLPSRPSLEQLRKQAKERLKALRLEQPTAKLADAQFAVAREYGFESWPKLVSHVEAITGAQLPQLTAPVSRMLGTTNMERAVRYWCEVLGFEAHESGVADGSVEVVNGKARIRFGSTDSEPYLEERRAPGSAVVFFETNDVDRLHDAIQARGGQPSELASVNWIKMRMFELRDPDGHALWFGQSYHKPSPPRPKEMMERIMPTFPLHDVAAGVRHYRDVLGFQVNYEQEGFGVLDRDNIRVLLTSRTPKHAGIGSAYVYIRDADGLHAELVAKGARVQGQPVSQPWGLREFIVLDTEGNELTFGQPFE